MFLWTQGRRHDVVQALTVGGRNGEADPITHPPRLTRQQASGNPQLDSFVPVNPLGRPVDQVVGCRDGSPARIVAPDPRWFALHKLWMSAQAKRNPLKRPKDEAQGYALLDAVKIAMPHYPLDEAFRSEIPNELEPMMDAWEQRQTSLQEPESDW